tara:strand:- start:236 stop:601 length:366 start_codon:yes stop_codon:yes gene_type:complete
MGIFDRISTVFKSNVNDLISKAEDPEKMINQMLIDMTEQYNEAKSEVAQAIAEEKKLQKAMEAEEAQVDNWSKKAELAVSKGDDQLALEALGRKKEAVNWPHSLEPNMSPKKHQAMLLKRV